MIYIWSSAFLHKAIDNILSCPGRNKHINILLTLFQFNEGCVLAVALSAKPAYCFCIWKDNSKKLLFNFFKPIKPDLQLPCTNTAGRKAAIFPSFSVWDSSLTSSKHIRKTKLVEARRNRIFVYKPELSAASSSVDSFNMLSNST